MSLKFPAPRREAPARRDRAAMEPTDPRWVLAVRTAAEMQGPVLTPDRRRRVLRFGRSMGLSPFDANLVIAIVQDQARRGHAPEWCPGHGVAQLRMVSGPRVRPRRLGVAGAVVSVLLIEALALLMLL